MRHRKSGVKLNRTSSHRDAMFRNMVTSLFKHERIRTTDAKAKELRRWADHLVTLAKRGDLHARRQALAIVREKAVVHKLFEEAQEKFGKRRGGYTRVIKLGSRPGDAAKISMIELVLEETAAKKKKAAPKPKAAPVKTPAVAEDAPAEDAAVAEADSPAEAEKEEAAAGEETAETKEAQPAEADEAAAETEAVVETEEAAEKVPAEKLSAKKADSSEAAAEVEAADASSDEEATPEADAEKKEE
jgi:large subunit ribosomal protein L17